MQTYFILLCVTEDGMFLISHNEHLISGTIQGLVKLKSREKEQVLIHYVTILMFFLGFLFICVFYLIR